MPTLSGKYLQCLSILLLCLAIYPAKASHLVGDEFTYKYLGTWSGLNHYQVTLVIYADCLYGQPEAIAQDNPAFFAVYNGSLARVEVDTNIYFSSSISLPGLSLGPCGLGSLPSICILKRTFVKDYYLPPSTTGYTITYQRCCKNSALTNIVDPGDNGSTYFCKIPPSGVAAINSGAVFTNDPPEAVSLNVPFAFDCSATDPDGDSLTYELCTTYNGVSAADMKPIPLPPPYDPVVYLSPLSWSNPMNCSVPLEVDPVTGVLSGTPNMIGRYLIAVACHEWRGGTMINTTQREFEFAVADFALSAYRPFAGNDTSILVGESVQFNGSGTVSYLWTPSTYLSDTTIYDPIGTFPVAGTFTYYLHGVSDSGCVGTDTINVLVMPHSEYRVPNGFTPNGDGINDYLTPISVRNSTLISFKVYNRDGKLIYTGTPQSMGWDGTFKGVKQGTGTYCWELFYLDNNGHTQEMKGNTILIR